MKILRTRIIVHRSRRKLPKIFRVFLSFTFMAGLFIYATNKADSVDQLKKENDCGKYN